MLRACSLCCVEHVTVLCSWEGQLLNPTFSHWNKGKSGSMSNPLYQKSSFFLWIHRYSCYTAKSLNFLSSCQALLNPPHSSLSAPNSLAEISDSKLGRGLTLLLLSAANSDVCLGSSTTDDAELSNLRATLACAHRTPPLSHQDALVAFRDIQKWKT